MNKASQNLKLQKWVAAISLLLLIVKFFAYYITHSVAILTDALESIANVAAGLIGLYSLYVAAKPRDFDHPYGHGKAEFLSAAVEGTLIVSAGAIILYKAIKNLLYPIPIHRVDFGIWLVAATAVVNFILGYYCLLIGKKNNSLALLASGKHLLSDTWSTLGIIVGLVLLHFTGYKWIDGVVAMLFGLLIIYTGYKILRRSIAGIMDEADIKLLSHLVTLLNHNRSVNWIDLHNLRVIKYGSVLHIDCHLTVPWFLNVNEAHNEVDALSALVRKEFGEAVELFVHTDGCLPFSCKICNKENCAERKYNFEKRIDWTLENISQNKKHELI
ncbi:MAG TPA: cation diffusion facilitator family transporter [Chitinophagaceae bacterium]|nr:cation diffusion facilitator family transporter [Chitinophagaceae bacterium]HNF38885.1 cation diffusion facilitator family transporter [Chitinophagaceae bacterium]HNF45794.1 cation diffusion facilitator family transporter [Chitinophagaceae bacterium]HNJ25810.1 cation diffusion facilitator family transporter [Chitinophagaceae bacterium]HNJ55611.1 cation diffusion facilitator family transporter [Chitinophagaceae bacterium]